MSNTCTTLISCHRHFSCPRQNHMIIGSVFRNIVSANLCMLMFCYNKCLKYA